MKKLLLVSLGFLMLLVTQVSAQNRLVTGTVTSKEDGLPIPGVTVKIKGTSVGVPTDANGEYSISTSTGSTLVFSYIAYENQEVVVSDKNIINISLAQNNKLLNEVVVVGYATTTKQAFTGTAKVVSSEQLEKKRVSNVSQALAGEVAGVRVINTSGQPGTVATIRVRGLGSVNGSRDPLYVLDGVAFAGGLNSINPADIESTTVLKDAAATAIYGSRGANGVVLVTTKSGKGKTGFIEAEFNYGTNVNLIPRYSVIRDPDQFIGLAWEALYNQGAGLATPAPDPAAYANARLFGPTAGGLPAASNIWNSTGANLIDPATRQVRAGITRKFDPERWSDYAFQRSARSEASVRLGGGSDKTSYYLSFGFLKDKGYSIQSDYQRVTGRLNVTHQVKPWLTGGANISYAYSETNNGGQTNDSGSIFWFIDNMPPIYPVFLRDANGTPVADPIFGGTQYDYGTTGRRFASLTNSIADTKYNTRRDDRNEINTSVNLNAKILPGLTFENIFGVQYWANNNVLRQNKFYGSAASQKGTIGLTRTSVTTVNLTDLLRYKKEFGDHSFEILGAHEITTYERGYLNASRYNLVSNDSEDLNNGVVSNPSSSYKENYRIDSYFANATYDFKKKYFLSGSIRRDGSSRFVLNKWGTFGSAGAGWLVSSEEFMKSQNVFSSLKLKASYGLIGDQAGVGFYPGYTTFGLDNVNNEPGFSFLAKGNPDLTWETSKMFQTGVEFGIGTFLEGSVDYYIKNTRNLIFDKRVPISLGYALIKVNGGTLRNTGLEFDLKAHIVKGKDYYFDFAVNGAFQTNKLTSMPIDGGTGKEKVLDPQGIYGWATGHSVYDFYTRVSIGVDPADGKSVWDQKYIDLNGNGKMDAGVYDLGTGEAISSLATVIGADPSLADKVRTTTTKTYASATSQFTGQSAIPTVSGAFNLTGGFKGFDLSVQFLYSLGGYAYDGAYATLMHNGLIASNNWSTDILGRWQKAGDVTTVPRLSNNQDLSANGQSTRFITKASYLTLNNVRLGYNLPKSIYSKLGIGGASLWISGDNLFALTARRGFNPSTAEAGSSDMYRYSPVSTLSAGIRAKF